MPINIIYFLKVKGGGEGGVEAFQLLPLRGACRTAKTYKIFAILMMSS